MSGIFNSAIFNNAIFNVGSATTPPSSVSAAGGGGGLGFFRTKKGKRRFNQFFDDIVDEMKREMEMERVAFEFEKRGKDAKRDLKAAREFVRAEQRKRRKRRALAFLLLDV